MLYYFFFNVHISGPMQFRLALFKGQQYANLQRRVSRISGAEFKKQNNYTGICIFQIVTT